MQPKWILILLISLVVVCIAIVLVVFSLNSRNLSPDEAQKQLIDCNSLQFGGEGGKNIVFFSNEETSKQYADYLLNQEPYSSNKNKLNFYYIDSNDYTPVCETYKGIAILCYSKELIKKASSCPIDLIVVLKNEAVEMRSSSYMNVMSLNINSPKTVFLHELGHALASLADEYIPSKIPSSSKNCQKSCESYQGLNEGCFQGCSNEDYSRSIENGIMRTLQTKSYGKFNEALILEKLTGESSGKLTGLATKNPVDCSKQEYVLIDGSYNSENNEKIEINSKTIETGCLGTNGAGSFEYKLNLQSGESLTDEFNPELIFTDSQETGNNNINGAALDYQGNFFLKIPIVENAKSLEIIKDKQILIELNLEDVTARPCKI